MADSAGPHEDEKETQQNQGLPCGTALAAGGKGLEASGDIERQERLHLSRLQRGDAADEQQHHTQGAGANGIQGQDDRTWMALGSLDLPEQPRLSGIVGGGSTGPRKNR